MVCSIWDAGPTKKQESMIRKYHNHTLHTNPRHGEEERLNNNRHNTPERQSKVTSSLFPIKLFVKLEKTQSNTQQNMEQTQYPILRATINNEPTATEPPN